MELMLDRYVDGPEFTRVNKTLKDKYGRPIVIAAYNPILDTRMHEVEYADGYKTEMTANAIGINLFSQVKKDGQRFVLFDAIIDFIPMAHISRMGTPLSICPMGKRGGDIPLKDGTFASDENMGVKLGTKLRKSRSPSCCN